MTGADDEHRYADDRAHDPRRHDCLRPRLSDLFHRRWFRGVLWTTGVLVVLFGTVAGGLWWRLNSGPIDLDIATPWLKAAIEENFGGKNTVAVGGTQIERDEKGRTSLRLRDIVVRDTDGTVVASAPKAEVGLSGTSLLIGSPRVQSLNLVGAEMAVRIETDGRVTIFAGSDNKRPIATAEPAIAPPPETKPAEPAMSPLRDEFANVAGVLTWLDGVGASGLAGHELSEIGLKNGSLTVDDRRTGKRWTFDHINVSLTRPKLGGITFRLESDNPKRPWVISAAMRPLSSGMRAIGLEVRKVAVRDILLAMRLDDGGHDIDLAISATVRADVGADGTLNAVQGQVVTDPGSVVDRKNPKLNIAIDRTDFRFNWDGRRRNLVVPFQVQSGSNQFTLRATIDAPAEEGGAWSFNLARGDTVIDPIILGGGTDEEGFAFNRVSARASIDLANKRITLEQGDFARVDTRPLYNLGIAVSGTFDWSGTEPHLAFGVAATRMPMSVMKRAWPIFAANDVRAWVDEHMSGGTVERVEIAGNAPLPMYAEDGPPMTDDGLSVNIETSGTTMRPVENLPAIRDADLNVRITGATATINLGRGTVEVDGGRKLNIASGVFSMPDTHPKPAPASARFRIDGTMPAAAALLSSDALRGNLAFDLDPDATRGTIAAQVTVKMLLGKKAPPNNATYAIVADLSAFSADKMLLGQKVEASSLRVTAGTDSYQVKGDIKLNGMPAAIDLRKQKNDAVADLRLTATLDEAARRKLGIDFGGAVTGAIPIKVSGSIGKANKDDRLGIEADLTPVKIDNLLPGWVKPAGKAARATYTLVKLPKSMRFDDLTIDGSGVAVKGSVELDAATNDILSANFPTFSLSDGDKVSVKADRGNDGALRVTMRGDVYDGRNFVKAAFAGAQDNTKPKQKPIDLDLDIKIGAVAGHNGETLRGLDLKLARRNGRIRSFAMTSKIGRDAPLSGDMRYRARDNHQVIYFETDDAGSLFRFTDLYPRMFNGQMWVAMDPPAQDQTTQVGMLFIRDFVVRGEPALDRVVSGAPGGGRGSVDFTELRTEFIRTPGRMSIRDGVVRGPLVGATIEGNIDYVRDDARLHGTFVPFYGLNNMFGQIPVLGLILGGGSNEGLVGITYEAVGPPSAPRISINPVSAIAPGLLRKFIPSPGTFDRNFIPPSR